MQWDKATDIILIAALAVIGVFASFGLYQWISRGSIKKVDRQILTMPIPLILMAIVYFVFDKFWIVSTRPNGSGESSFPSTHVMVVATILFMTMLALPKYIKSKLFLAIADIAMLSLIALTAAGRILSDMHWPTDVIGGTVFAIFFAVIYYIIKKEKHV